MIVTKLEEHDKKRLDVSIDGEHAFYLYKGEVRQYKLKEGEEIPEEVYETIVGTVLRKRAILRAMNLLQKKDYTEYKLREKLRDGGYPQVCCDAAVDYVKSYHYLDDHRFAEDYARYYMESRSRTRISQDLMRKGIDRDLIREILEAQYTDESDAEENQVRHLLEKKHYSKDMEYKEKQKIMAFLFRKGYGTDLIHRVMEMDNY